MALICTRAGQPFLGHGRRRGSVREAVGPLLRMRPGLPGTGSGQSADLRVPPTESSRVLLPELRGEAHLAAMGALVSTAGSLSVLARRIPDIGYQDLKSCGYVSDTTGTGSQLCGGPLCTMAASARPYPSSRLRGLRSCSLSAGTYPHEILDPSSGPPVECGR